MLVCIEHAEGVLNWFERASALRVNAGGQSDG
jgi:hypothetical protein